MQLTQIAMLWTRRDRGDSVRNMGMGPSKLRRERSWLVDRPIAHRGLHDLSRGIPENTLAAFDAAADRRLPIEFDVRLTEDGQAVVFHDENLGRLTGIDRLVAATTLREMKSLRIAGTEERPPSLFDALEFINGRVPVLIELKTIGRPGPLEAAVSEAVGNFSGLAAVQSFSPRSMQWFRENAPGVMRGQISGAYHGHGLTSWHRFVHRHLLMLRISRPHFVAHHVGCLGLPASRLWRRLGGPLLAWTVRSARDLDRARGRADGLIFEGFDPLKGGSWSGSAAAAPIAIPA